MNEVRLPFEDYCPGHDVGKVVPSVSLWKDHLSIPSPTSIQLGYSRGTSLLSLVQALPGQQLKRSHEWIRLNEPESHLTAVADVVLIAGKHKKGLRVRGLTRKDAPLLQLLESRGCRVLNVLELQDDVEDIVTHQARLSHSDAHAIGRNKRVDVLVARHILEHTYDMRAFLHTVGEMIHADGHIVLEVPDTERSIAALNYSELWEEHLHYFTLRSLKLALSRLGWRVCHIAAMVSDGESILVCLARPPLSPNVQDAEQQHEAGEGNNAPAKLFCSSIGKARDIAERQLTSAGAARIVFLGANHCTSTVIDLISPPQADIAVVDDDPRKVGLFTSSHMVRVHSTAEISLHSSDLVLVSINPTRAAPLIRRIDQMRGEGPMMFTSQWGVAQE